MERRRKPSNDSLKSWKSGCWRRRRAAAIQVNPGVIAVTFDVNTDRPQSSARSLIDLYRSRLRFTAPHAFQVSGPTGEWKNVFQELKRILQVLAVHDKKP